MLQSIDLKWAGLFTHPNRFSEVPQGAMAQADNVVLDRESIVTSRRGNNRYGNSFGAVSVRSIFEFQGKTIVNTSDNNLWYDSDGLGTWVQYTGSYSVPDSTVQGSRVHSASANKNFYMCTSAGILKQSQITDNPIPAGAPRALGGIGSTTGASGFMNNNVNVAYRVVWGYKDSNSNLILGAPSQRIVVSNTTGHTANVSLTFQIPSGIDTNWFYQVYRSDQTLDLVTDPTDEMYQVYENVPTSGELSADSVTITDNVPDDLRQAALYTSASREGIENANYQPPFALDMDLYRDQIMYANTRTLHSFDLSMTSVGATAGVQVGDTITFTDAAGGAFTLTASASENTTTGAFLVVTSGTPAQNINDTALSLIRVLNAYPGNTFLNGYYQSSFSELPGQMQFQKKTLNAQPFYLTGSRSTCWSPHLDTTGTTNASTNDVSPNRVYFSKIQQPESVPLGNYLNIGSASYPIRRIIALRDGVIILKDDGVFRISGTSAANFNVAAIDQTVKIVAPLTAVALANQVYFLSNQGVVSAADNGINIISRPIDRTLLALTSPTIYPQTPDISFAISYDSDHEYILYIQTSPTDPQPTQAFVFNTITSCWYRWTQPFVCGMLSPTQNLMVMGSYNNPVFGGYVYKERKTYTDLDYCDEDYGFNIVSYSGLTLTIDDSSNLAVGYTIQQNEITGISTAIITGVIDSTHITVDLPQQWAASSAIAYVPIDCVITTIQQDCGNPGMVKHFSEISLLFMEVNFDKVTVGFTSDFTSSPSTVDLLPTKVGGWGQFAWGELPWGGDIASGQQRIRTLVPRAYQRCNWIIVSVENQQAFTTFGLAGVSIGYNTMSMRQR